MSYSIQYSLRNHTLIRLYLYNKGAIGQMYWNDIEYSYKNQEMSTPMK